MRIRSIKPEFWTDKKVSEWSHFTRLFYIGLWSAADDHGRGSAEPARLAAELFPYDLSRDSRETLANVSEALDRLSKEGRIAVFEVESETFFEIENWAKHQKIDHPGKSRFPSKSDGSAKSSRDSRETLATVSRLDQGSGIRDQGSGSEGARGVAGLDLTPKGAADAEKDAKAERIAQVESVWAIWPKKVGTGPGQMAILRAIERHGIARVMTGTSAIAAAMRGRERYLPKPEEFFDSLRYLDDPASYAPAEPSGNGNGSGNAFLREAIEELQDQISGHRGNPESVTYTRQDCTPELTQEFRALREKLKQLKQSKFQ